MDSGRGSDPGGDFTVNAARYTAAQTEASVLDPRRGVNEGDPEVGRASALAPAFSRQPKAFANAPACAGSCNTWSSARCRSSTTS